MVQGVRCGRPRFCSTTATGCRFGSLIRQGWPGHSYFGRSNARLSLQGNKVHVGQETDMTLSSCHQPNSTPQPQRPPIIRLAGGVDLVPKGANPLAIARRLVKPVLDERRERPLSEGGLAVLLDDVKVCPVGTSTPLARLANDCVDTLGERVVKERKGGLSETRE
jgi:hypothetical protein